VTAPGRGAGAHRDDGCSRARRPAGKGAWFPSEGCPERGVGKEGGEDDEQGVQPRPGSAHFGIGELAAPVHDRVWGVATGSMKVQRALRAAGPVGRRGFSPRPTATAPRNGEKGGSCGRVARDFGEQDDEGNGPYEHQRDEGGARTGIASVIHQIAMSSPTAAVRRAGRSRPSGGGTPRPVRRGGAAFRYRRSRYC